MYHQTRQTSAMKHHLKWKKFFTRRNPSKSPSNSMLLTPHSVFGKPFWIRTTIHCTLHCRPFFYRKRPNNRLLHCWNLLKRSWTSMRSYCVCAKTVWTVKIWFEHSCSSVSSRWARSHHLLRHRILTTIYFWFTTLRSKTNNQPVTSNWWYKKKKNFFFAINNFSRIKYSLLIHWQIDEIKSQKEKIFKNKKFNRTCDSCSVMKE